MKGATASDASSSVGQTLAVKTKDGVVLIVGPDGVSREDGEPLLQPTGIGTGGPPKLTELFVQMIEGNEYAAVERALRGALESDAVARVRAFFDRGLDQGELFLKTSFIEPFSAIVHNFATMFPRRAATGPASLPYEASPMTLLAMPSGQLPTGPEVYYSALALSMMPDRLVAHAVRPDVAALVGATQVRSLPDAPPRMLRRACVVEVKDPTKEALFGSTVGLAAYEHEGRYTILGFDYPKGAHIVAWEPSWRGGDVEDGAAVDIDHALTRIQEGKRGEHVAWTQQAARFLLVLGILLDARDAPVNVEDESSRPAAERDRPLPKKGRGGAKARKPAWVTRYVSLDRSARRPAADHAPNAPAASTNAGRIARENTPVSGHLRRKPCGPGQAEREWIWVDGYEARRWVSPAPVKIVVTT